MTWLILMYIAGWPLMVAGLDYYRHTKEEPDRWIWWGCCILWPLVGLCLVLMHWWSWSTEALRK